uniref:Homeobox protein n=1 Tax=Solanum tuberosum TaxID=4113 RepID=M1D427_SOLTU
MEGHSDMNERKESLINVVIGGSGEEEIERSSIGDNITGGASVDERGESSSKRKKPIRHNADQIQELELFFKKNSLPNKKVRLELATKLSMDINQVQNWFQNKRTQVKLQLELYENKTLKQENDKLRIENIVMKEALKNSIRDNFKENIDENQIKIEHDQLEDEVKWLTAQAYKSSLFNKDVVQDKMVLLNLAMDALNELFRLYENDKPLWVSSLDGGGETLNIKEYARLFTLLIGTKPEHFTTEATTASGTVADTSLALVNTLMDKREWVEMFPCIVGKIYTTDVISTGIGGNKSGSLLLIKTELQIISDLVYVREVQFLHFCKKHAEGVWAIVDVSVDTIQEGDDSGANRVVLQDTCMDATGSLLVYATIDSQEINTVMKGGDSSCVTLFSNGITIVLDCFQDFFTTNNYNVISGEMNNGFGGGSLMTTNFQIVGNIFPATTLSMELVKEANALTNNS